MAKKDLLSIYDLTVEEISVLLEEAFKLKSEKKYLDVFKGKTLGMIFEKPSTRTRVSFTVAMIQLGGAPIALNPENLQRKRGESIHDTAVVLSSYLNGLVIRAFKHSDTEEFAKYSTIPVINALSDYEHPCQVVADIMTVMELHKIKTIKALREIKIVYTGDSNNVANSLLAMAAVLGLNFTLISPEQCLPKKYVRDKASEYALASGAEIKITSDIAEAEGADVIYTDVWLSMGCETEKKDRKKVFVPYQVNAGLLRKASPGCIVLHCLPAVRGEEITAEIIDKYEYSIFTQAENRLHAQKAILMRFLV
ncbi:MAG: ornithine carbamoyltransferase [Endomicrobium sp.]|jgi:ornithine carbamoyltransferase|nr:ornithine carbamoyltransferase [Endomicrobium sp.]